MLKAAPPLIAAFDTDVIWRGLGALVRQAAPEANLVQVNSFGELLRLVSIDTRALTVLTAGHVSAVARHLSVLTAVICPFRIIVLARSGDAASVRLCADSGVSLHIGDAVSRRILGAAIDSARNAEQPAVLSVTRTALARRPAAASRDAGPGLSDRERELVALAAVGASNREIARTLRITEGTVKQHFRHIFNKLGVVNKIGAINACRLAGLLPEVVPDR